MKTGCGHLCTCFTWYGDCIIFISRHLNIAWYTAMIVFVVSFYGAISVWLEEHRVPQYLSWVENPTQYLRGSTI